MNSPDKSDEPNFPTLSHVIVIISLVGISITLLWYFRSESEGVELNTVLEVTTALILGSITAVIAYRQYQTTKRQTDIEDTLKDLESKPYLEVADYEIKNDGINIYLANFGFGPAYNLKLEMEVDCDTDNYEFGVAQLDLKRSLDEDTNLNLASDAILPTSTASLYRTSMIEVHDKKEDEYQAFSVIFDEISDHEEPETKFTIHLRVTGKDSFGNQLPSRDVRGPCKFTVDDIKGLDNYGPKDVISREPN